jgi:hypothetical protein
MPVDPSIRPGTDTGIKLGDCDDRAPTWFTLAIGVALRNLIPLFSGILLQYGIVRRAWHGFDAPTIAAFAASASIPLANYAWGLMVAHRLLHTKPPSDPPATIAAVPEIPKPPPLPEKRHRPFVLIVAEFDPPKAPKKRKR